MTVERMMHVEDLVTTTAGETRMLNSDPSWPTVVKRDNAITMLGNPAPRHRCFRTLRIPTRESPSATQVRTMHVS